MSVQSIPQLSFNFTAVMPESVVIILKQLFFYRRQKCLMTKSLSQAGK